MHRSATERVNHQYEQFSVNYPSGLIRRVSGVFGIECSNSGTLRIANHRQLIELMSELEDLFRRRFKPTARLKSPSVFITVNAELEQPAESPLDAKCTLPSTTGKSPQVRVEDEMQLLEYEFGKVVFRGLFAIQEDKRIHAADMKLVRALDREIQQIIQRFPDTDLLRLRRIAVIFNPYYYRRIAAASTINAAVDEAMPRLRTTSKFALSDLILSADVIDTIGELVFEVTNRAELTLSGRLLGSHDSSRIVLSLAGPPGTGKTCLAHAIASELHLPINEFNYADIDDPRVGVAQKNVRDLFNKNNNADVVLFLDEADALLSHRPRSLSQSADYHVSSLRNEFFSALNTFTGILIVASNNSFLFDPAFTSRVTHTIRTELPDGEARSRLFQFFLPTRSTINQRFSYETVASESAGLSGRDIEYICRRSVIRAAKRSIIEPITETLVCNLIEEIRRRGKDNTPVDGIWNTARGEGS